MSSESTKFLSIYFTVLTLTVFRFVDRDMFMRYLGGGVGHTMLRGVVDIADTFKAFGLDDTHPVGNPEEWDSESEPDEDNEIEDDQGPMDDSDDEDEDREEIEGFDDDSDDEESDEDDDDDGDSDGDDEDKEA